MRPLGGRHIDTSSDKSSGDSSPRDVVELLTGVGVYRRNGHRSVLKPLLVLLALADLQRGGSGSFRFRDIERKMLALSQEFSARPSSVANAHYPFWYLKNDGFWIVKSEDNMPPRTGKGVGGEPAITTIRKVNPTGGLVEGVAITLRSDPALLGRAASAVVAAAFPETRRRDVLDAVGISPDVQTFARVDRDPEFRQTVLREYNYTCAICGFDGKLGLAPVGIEAAHIKMISYGGPNDVRNGIALCSLHHKLFDAGAITVSEDFGIQVSARFAGGSDHVRSLLREPRRSLRLPARLASAPDEQYLRWHRSELFLHT